MRVTEIEFTSDLSARLIDWNADDEMVVAAARVSTQGVRSEDYLLTPAEESTGLINFLMRNRHGCYDSGTDVLTREGWKCWPEVDGGEEFLTLNLDTDEMEYQRAERVVHKPVDGPMVRLQMAQVDALVTPDHRMVAAPRTRRGWERGLHPARALMERSHRLLLGGGIWGGELHVPELAALVGFIAADGNVNGGSISFRLRRERKVEWLQERATVRVDGDRYYLVDANPDLVRWAKQTYTDAGDRCLPRELLLRGDQETVEALLDGYLEGDGSVSATGKVTASTVSRQMVDDLQEVALKAGLAAVETTPDLKRTGAYGDRPLYRLTMYRGRNMEPRIGWTQEARAEQVQVEHYGGMVHCVTVPNGTLYVRRNGKPMWCGNTPFEHNFFCFLVEAPIAVFREWMRHRIGVSYNEESGRYKQLAPKFYLPPPERPLTQVGKPGAYEFVPGDRRQYDLLDAEVRSSCAFAYRSYEAMLEKGIAREVARGVLPVYIYSSMYFTCNARSLMNFLQLRTAYPPDEAMFPSKPMWEIARLADQVEEQFAEYMPLTHGAFVAAKRVSP